MKAGLIFAVLLVGCGSNDRAADAVSAGAGLENAAVAAGLVPDPNRAGIVGAWARDTDRVCIVQAADDSLRIGAIVDYGEGTGCVGVGTARRSRDRIAVTFGKCRMNATFDGERITFPSEVSADCESLCTARASFTALSVAQVSASVSEASTLRAPNGRLLCAN